MTKSSRRKQSDPSHWPHNNPGRPRGRRCGQPAGLTHVKLNGGVLSNCFMTGPKHFLAAPRIDAWALVRAAPKYRPAENRYKNQIIQLPVDNDPFIDASADESHRSTQVLVNRELKWGSKSPSIGRHIVNALEVLPKLVADFYWDEMLSPSPRSGEVIWMKSVKRSLKHLHEKIYWSNCFSVRLRGEWQRNPSPTDSSCPGCYRCRNRKQRLRRLTTCVERWADEFDADSEFPKSASAWYSCAV